MAYGELGAALTGAFEQILSPAGSSTTAMSSTAAAHPGPVAGGETTAPRGLSPARASETRAATWRRSAAGCQTACRCWPGGADPLGRAAGRPGRHGGPRPGISRPSGPGRGHCRRDPGHLRGTQIPRRLPRHHLPGRQAPAAARLPVTVPPQRRIQAESGKSRSFSRTVLARAPGPARRSAAPTPRSARAASSSSTLGLGR